MSTLYEDLYQGLTEAIDYEVNNKPAKTTTYIIEPVKHYTHTDVKRIRNHAGMTQRVFSYYMGVSQKTVEAWESGRTHPTGPACRLLCILDEGKEKELSFISVV